MAIFHLSAKIVQRSKGHSAVAAAAYRARMEITNERTGETWNYSKNNADVLFEGVFTPQNAPAWMRNRPMVWNALEKAERQWNGQVARDFTIALPHELSLEQQTFAVKDWVKENFTRKGFIADIAIHRPSSHGDTRNTHAHVLVSMRTVEGGGFATAKHRTKDKYADLEAWRTSWEFIGNKMLARNGHLPTLDRRSLQEQGSDLTPTIHLGKDAASLERDGKATDRGDILRAIHRENAAKILQQQIDAATIANANTAAREKANDDVPQIEKPRAATVEEQTAAAQSAIDRMKAEDRAAQIETLKAIGRNRWASMGDELRGIVAAVRSLAVTMGSAVFDIVKGGGFFQAKVEKDYLKAMQEKPKKPAATSEGGKGLQKPARAQEAAQERDKAAAERVRAEAEAKAAQDGARGKLERLTAERLAAKQKAAREAANKLRDDLHRGKPSRDREPDI